MTREELIAKAKRKHLIDQAKAKFARSQELPTNERTVQEQHPDISWQDRMIAKNLAQDQGKQVEFLQSKYPDLKFDISAGGQIRAKSPGSNEWNVLDPDTGFFSSDFLSDVGDIGYDLYSGVSEGAATLGGAAVGNIPGAIGAGAASTAGNEAMRQKLGQYLGIPQEVSGEDVAISGAVGAAAPVLFGAGKAKGAVQMGGEFIGDGLRKINPLPYLGEKISGIPRASIRNFYDGNIDDAVEGLNKSGVYDYSLATNRAVSDLVEGETEAATKALVGEIDNIGRPVNMKPAKASYLNAENKIINDDVVTNSDAQTYEQLRAAYNKYFGLAGDAGEYVPDRLSANKAWRLQKDLKREAKFGKDMTPADYEMKGTARDAYHKINKALDRASGGASQKAKDRFKSALSVEGEVLPKITGKTDASTADKTFKTFSNLDRQSNRIYAERLQRLVTGEAPELAAKNPWYKLIGKPKPDVPKLDPRVQDIMDRAKVLNAYKYFGDDAGTTLMQTVKENAKTPLGVGLGLVGGYSTGQKDLTGNKALDYSLGAGAGVAAGAAIGSKAAMKAYIRSVRKAGKLKDALTPENQGLYRGMKNALGIEALLDPE